MGAAHQNTARAELGEGCPPKVFGGMVDPHGRAETLGQMERREGSEYEGG